MVQFRLRAKCENIDCIDTDQSFLRLRRSFQSIFDGISKHFWTNNSGWRSVQRSVLWRSRRELSNEYPLAKTGFDTAENEPSQIGRGRSSWPNLPMLRKSSSESYDYYVSIRDRQPWSGILSVHQSRLALRTEAKKAPGGERRGQISNGIKEIGENTARWSSSFKFVDESPTVI